ncbi:hypothetical protein CBS101457_001699 [Exobasidium rhododendri]|nr:hypothetical protein CBS101457_001699 [Exobasidium rhododendri]
MTFLTLRLSFLLLSVALLQLYVPSVTAFGLLYPSTDTYWVTNSTNQLHWSHTPEDPSYFSVELLNSNSSSLAGNFQIGNALTTENGTAKIPLDLIPTGKYTLLFVNSSNYALDHPQVYFTSQVFDIKPSGTTAAPFTPPTELVSASNKTSTESTHSATSVAVVTPTSQVKEASNASRVEAIPSLLLGLTTIALAALVISTI